MACEGVFAINKPKSISSAQALRDLQQVFNPSNFFAPWLEAERQKIFDDRNNRKGNRWKKKKQKLQVKLGHGGTLDPMATGVLIIGVGKGTKSLQSFLGCTKSYEATILFGAATDTYDTLGKVLSKAPYDHVTLEEVEKALPRFRGNIMQRPPLYSALHVQGKRLYEYAREGKEVPVEIEERPVEVEELEIVEWLPGGTHNHRWPAQEAEKEDKVLVEKVLHLGEVLGTGNVVTHAEAAPETSIGKRKRSVDGVEEALTDTAPVAKRQETEDTFLMSGALQSPDDTKSGSADPQEVSKQDLEVPGDKGPPAVKIRMTVTSGFYVRSLAHDLGKAIGSLGCMSELVRTRQEQFDLGRNVLEMDIIDKGEEVWAPALEVMLEGWEKRAVDPNQVSSHDGKLSPNS